MKKPKLFDIVLIGVALISITVFSLIRFRKATYITVVVKADKEEAIDPSWTDMSWASITRVWFANLFYVGMTEKDGLGKGQAEVKDIFVYDKLPAEKYWLV